MLIHKDFSLKWSMQNNGTLATMSLTRRFLNAPTHDILSSFATTPIPIDFSTPSLVVVVVFGSGLSSVDVPLVESRL